MRSWIILGVLAVAGIPACANDEVPNITGSYTCALEADRTSWCGEGKSQPHIVTDMNITIAQDLPGSGMSLEGWQTKLAGSVGLDGDVHARVEHARCSTCEASNEYELRFEAKAVDGVLKGVLLRELRHSDHPERDDSDPVLFASAGTCIAFYSGTCTPSTPPARPK